MFHDSRTMKKIKPKKVSQPLLWAVVTLVAVTALGLALLPLSSENRAEYFPENNGLSQPVGKIVPAPATGGQNTAPARGVVDETVPEVEISTSISLRCIAESTGLPIPFMGRVSGDEVADHLGILVLEREVARRRPVLYLGGWVPQRVAKTTQDGDTLSFVEATASLVVDFEGVRPDWKLVQSHLYFPKLPQIKTPPWESALQGTPAGRLLGSLLPEGACTVSVTLSAPGRQHWTLTKSGAFLRAGETTYVTLRSNPDTFDEE